ncbi:MAG: hypothetical protein JSU96_14080 [Acidobacteriota bacterium]|nr:MAG: hypothetical protein JSU96_14080 [Acidobacteriota bacterium]
MASAELEVQHSKGCGEPQILLSPSPFFVRIFYYLNKMETDSRIDQHRAWIENRASADPVLGRPDESPRLRQLVSELVGEIDSFQDRFRTESERLNQALSEALAGAEAELAKAKAEAEDSIDQLRRNPSPEATARLGDKLRSLTHRLYSRIRGIVNLRLQGVSPVSQVFLRVQNEEKQIFDRLRNAWPREITLVVSNATDEGIDGNRILDLESERLLNWCSAHRFLWLCRIHFRFARFRLRRGYRIHKVPALDTFNEYFPAGETSFDSEFRTRQLQTAEKLKATLEESWQITRFNLDLAAVTLSDELNASGGDGRSDELLDESHQMIVSAMDRTVGLLRELSVPFSQILTEAVSVMDERFGTRLGLMEKDLFEAGTLAANLRWYRRASRRYVRESQHSVSRNLKRLFFWVFGYAKRGYYYLEDLVLWFGGWLGLSIRSRERLLALADLPREPEVREKLKSFPPIYRRLFTSDPLLNEEFLVGRAQETATFQEVVKRWGNGRRASAVIVGQIGSGKTSLLNHLESVLQSQHTSRRVEFEHRLTTEADLIAVVSRWFDLKKKPDTAEDLQAILRTLPRQVVFIEAGHHLMLRSIGGRQAAEAFFRLLLATRDHLLWIMTVRERPWAMLGYQVKAGQYFTHEIRTRFSEPSQLREAIMTRHRSSGCRLLFSEEGIEDRALRKLRATQPLESEPVQSFLADRFFSNLYEVSGGNMTAGTYYWLTSMEYDSINKVLRLNPIQSPDLSILRGFESQSLFCLGEIMNHGVLSVRELAEIFQINVARAQLILDYLLHLRLIEIDRSAVSSKSTEYTANPVLIHQINSTLESMNILY